MHSVLAILAQAGPIIIGLLVLAIWLFKSLHRIGPLEVGLVRKNFGLKKLVGDCVIAFDGEAGYQAELLKPGIRFRGWPLSSVTKYPWVQIPTDGIGVVVAQIGKPLPQGSVTAPYNSNLGAFTDPKGFLDHGGSKGIQRNVLQPGEVVPMHPIAFLVLASNGVYGHAIGEKFEERRGGASLKDFGIEPDQLNLVTVDYCKFEDGSQEDAIGVVTVLDGPALDPTDIACRLGGWSDIEAMLADTTKMDAEIIAKIFASKNGQHNNYQDMQAFFDAGGRRGLQHDPLMPGHYALNPFLVHVEIEAMLEVQQGEVEVVKAFVGLKTEDISGDAFKHGQIVRPGRRGLWRDPLRTGKYAINPRLYSTETVATKILTLNWSARTGEHGLDENLKAVDAKSSEGFDFKLDLQVQIHVADTNAPKVISAVGSVANLVHEVMRPAVGNFFRNKLASQSATAFITQRGNVQTEATTHVAEALKAYDVEVKGVYIQEVQLPADLVKVLQERELANQNKETYTQQMQAEVTRSELEAARGKADAQHSLAHTEVEVQIATNRANAMTAAAEGEAQRIRKLGDAEGAKIEAIGVATGKAYTKQVEAVGKEATALINVAKAIGDGRIKIVPDILVAGNGASGGSAEGLAATLMGFVKNFGSGATPDAAQAAPASAPAEAPKSNGASAPAAPPA